MGTDADAVGDVWVSVQYLFKTIRSQFSACKVPDGLDFLNAWGTPVAYRYMGCAAKERQCTELLVASAPSNKCPPFWNLNGETGILPFKFT